MRVKNVIRNSLFVYPLSVNRELGTGNLELIQRPVPE